MKTKYLAIAFLGGVASFGLTACGDDVITVEGENTYSIVQDLDSIPCTKDNEGAMAMVKGEGKLYVCSQNNWKPVAADQAVDLRCKSEPLADSTGYNIICDGEIIATIHNSGVAEMGKSAYELAKEAGFKGTEKEWLASLAGANGKSAYETAVENGFDGSEEEWFESLSGSSGKSAYELAKEGGYEGTEEEWLESLSGSNGKSAYEIAKEGGYKGTEEQWLKSLKGKNGTSVNGDSLAGVLLDSLACKVDSSWTDTAKAEINVAISCGEGSSVITLPTLIPNKNLTKHYKKHVVVRLPVMQSPSRDETEPVQELWNSLKLDGAIFTAMEVDSNFDKTGKSFSSELLLSNGKAYKTYESVNQKEASYQVVRLEGDVDITNMMNSLAQFQVEMDVVFNDIRWNRYADDRLSQTVVFNAFVDMDESDTVVIDFLTDYKAARTKTLMTGNKKKTFAAASAQANTEIAAAFEIGGENAPVLEQYLPDSLELNENMGLVLWPALLIAGDNFSVLSYSTVYGAYKSQFAKTGAVNGAVTGAFKGDEKERFLVDYIVLTLSEFDTSHAAIDSLMSYKVVQRGLAEAYGLPACDMNLDNPVFVVEGPGSFESFTCNAVSENWSVSELPAAGCANRKEGEFVERSVITSSGSMYVECVKDAEGNMVEGDDVSDAEYLFQTRCNSTTKDTLYYKPFGDGSFSLGKDRGFFAVCIPNENGGDFRIVSTDNGVDSVAWRQVGKCTDDREGEIKYVLLKARNYYGNDTLESWVKCEAGSWKRTSGVSTVLGVCDVDKMNEHGIYKVNEKEIQMSTLTGYAYYKCDCEPGYDNQQNPIFERCEWDKATMGEIKLNRACDIASEGELSDDEAYVCKDKKWDDVSLETFCAVKKKNISNGAEGKNICSGFPGDDYTYLDTLRAVNTWSKLEDYFYNVDCSSAKIFTNLSGYNYHDGDTTRPVHDLICKDGIVKEAVDEQEACDAAFEHTDICLYMEEYYFHNGKKWEKAKCEVLEYRNDSEGCIDYSEGDDFSGEWCTYPTSDLLCEISGKKLYKASSGNVRRWDSAAVYGFEDKYFTAKFYDMEEYCAAKGNLCFKEGDEPNPNTVASFSCDFLGPYVQHKVYICDRASGSWVESNYTSAEQFCKDKLKFDIGVEDCTDEAVAAVYEEPDNDQWYMNVPMAPDCVIPQSYGLELPDDVADAMGTVTAYCANYAGVWTWTWQEQ